MSASRAATVAIVGRPNVGKSALFNRIVGGHAAHRRRAAGTTRDRHFGEPSGTAARSGSSTPAASTTTRTQPMDARSASRCSRRSSEADLVLFVVDAKVGVHPDAGVAEHLRGAAKPWLLVANKVDDRAARRYCEFYELGAGDPLPVSAHNGKGSGTCST